MSPDPSHECERLPGGEMDYKDMQLEQILKEESLVEYRRGLDFFWVQLTRLHTDVFILQKIREFPWEFFCAPRTPVFFYRAVHNALDISILQIVKLVQDQGNDVFNLPKFKKKILLDYLRPEHERDLRAKLAECKFDEETRRLLQKAENLRDRQIAHFLQGDNFQLRLDDFLSLDDLKSLTKSITALFEVLSFGPRQRYLPMEYDPSIGHPDGTDTTPDIVRLLDQVARESPILNLPETNPIGWGVRRLSLPQDYINQLNTWRAKFGLPEA
jgi:hypothetical protein